MKSKVLVAYATRLGSTRETAEFIANALRKEGLDVDLEPMAEVQSLERYRAVVMLAALYIGRLHQDARAFLTKHRAELEQLQVALFVPGPVDSAKKSWDGARAQLKTKLAHYPWLKPIACHVIGGMWDPATMSYPWKLVLRKVPACDVRDWESIGALAREVAGALQPADR
jgi:menaquinone-dependent protoporphyrinogen oxidase